MEQDIEHDASDPSLTLMSEREYAFVPFTYRATLQDEIHEK